MARTASPGILMLALLLTATTTQAKKPMPVRPQVLPQPTTSAELSTPQSADDETKLSCL